MDSWEGPEGVRLIAVSLYSFAIGQRPTFHAACLHQTPTATLWLTSKKKTQTEEQKLPSNIRKHIENTNKQKGKVKLKQRGNKFQRERKIPTYNQYK